MPRTPFEQGWNDRVRNEGYNSDCHHGDAQRQYQEGYRLAPPLNCRRVEDVVQEANV